MALDVENAIIGSFAWLKRKESIKYAGIIFGFQLIIVLFSLFYLILVPDSSAGHVALTPLVFILSIFLGWLVRCITQIYALRSFGFGNVTFNSSKYNGFFNLMIISVALALLWSFDKRLRIMQLFCLGLAGLLILWSYGGYLTPTAMSIMGVSAWPKSYVQATSSDTISRITGFATSFGTTYNSVSTSRGGPNIFFPIILFTLILLYFAIVLYNATRLCLGSVIFLSKEIGAMAALEESWMLTKGNVIGIIAVNLLVTIIYFIPMAVIGAVFYLFYILAGGKIYVNQTPVKSTISQNLIWEKLTDALVAPISVLTENFMLVVIYSMLSEEYKKKIGSEIQA